MIFDMTLVNVEKEEEIARKEYEVLRVRTKKLKTQYASENELSR